MTTKNPFLPMSILSLDDATLIHRVDFTKPKAHQKFYGELLDATSKHFNEEKSAAMVNEFKDRYNMAAVSRMGEKETHLCAIYAFPDDQLHWRWESKNPIMVESKTVH